MIVTSKKACYVTDKVARKASPDCKARRITFPSTIVRQVVLSTKHNYLGAENVDQTYLLPTTNEEPAGLSTTSGRQKWRDLEWETGGLQPVEDHVHHPRVNDEGP